ncbi:MAG: dephospho-CoA kinase [Pararhodobacter sp.]
MTFVLGLTGSIGTGKSTTAKMFRCADIPVWDADAAVHALYAENGAAVDSLSQLCPSALINGAIDREALKEWIAREPDALCQIEEIVHPLVARDRAVFLAQHRHAGTRLVVLDVPLLFESGADKLCDAVLVVTVDADIQRERVLARPMMTPEHFKTLLAKQMPDNEKRARATYVIETRSLDQTRDAIAALIEKLSSE